jgi:predicted MFS family arabinose efflux permease
MFVNHLNVIAWNPFLPFIAAELGVTVALLGQVPALMMLLSTSLGLVIGPLADHSGYRRMMLVCLLAVVTSSLATGLAATLPLLVVAALVGAVGRAAIMPVAQAIVATTFGDEAARRRAVSRTQSGGPLAATVGVPLLTASAAVLHWRGAFVVLSGLALATAFLLWRGPSRNDATDSEPARLQRILAAYRPLICHRASRTCIVAACLEQTGVWVMWTYYGAFYVQQYAFSTPQIGWVSLAAGLGVLLGQTAAGGRLGSRPGHLFLVGLRWLRTAYRPVADAPPARLRSHRPHGSRVADARPGHGQHRGLAGWTVASRTGDDTDPLRRGDESWHRVSMAQMYGDQL